VSKNVVRRGPSGPTRERVIASGRVTVPAGASATGPTLERRPSERITIYIFPVTPMTGPPGSTYSVTGDPAKVVGMADDEWAPLFYTPNVALLFDVEVDWIAIGKSP